MSRRTVNARREVYDNPTISCKIGSIPMLIYAMDRRTPFEVGRTMRIKKRRGAKWEHIIIREITEGHFKADWL